MKKKLLAAALVIVLVFSLSMPVMAANSSGGSTSPNIGTSTGTNEDKSAQIAARARIMTCLSTMTQNRALMLNCAEENLQLSSQLRTELNELKASNTTVTPEALALLTTLKTQLQAKRDELAGTRGDIDSLMSTYREFRQAGDLESAATVLDQVMLVQQSRLLIRTDISSLLQQMLDCLNSL